MKYKVHKTLEAKNPKRKAALDNRIKKELNISDDSSSEKTEIPFKKPFYKTYRFFAGISTALVAVCLAIVLPMTLNKGEDGPTIHYRNAEDCLESQIEYSLKEYSERNNVSYLYIDWYNIAEEIQTKLYFSMDNPDDLIYIQEMLVNGETGSIVFLSITDKYTRLDILEAFEDVCITENVVEGIIVKSGSFGKVDKAYFEYGNYRYFIELSYPLSDDYILEVIEGMIP